MNESDIEFTVGLDVSDADKKLDSIQQKMKSTFNESGANQGYSDRDAFAYERMRLIKERNDLNRAARSFYSEAYNKATMGDIGGAAMAKSSAVDAAAQAHDREQKIKFYNAKLKEIDKEFIAETGITDESKAQNRELADQIIKLGKILSIIALIKAAVGAIKNAWGYAFGKAADINAERGFLLKDAPGAFKANYDKNYAMIIQGAKNLGKASPFTAEEFGSAMEKIQIAREKAMAGSGVDEEMSIAAQRLSQMFGIKLNAEQLLTGSPGKTNYEVLEDILNTLEGGLGKLGSMGSVEQNQALHYMRTLIGPLADAIMTSYNQNLITGDTRTAVEKVQQAGVNAAVNLPMTKTVNELVTEMGQVKSAFAILKDVLLLEFSPALLILFETIEKAVNWLANNTPGQLAKKGQEELAGLKASLAGETSVNYLKNLAAEAYGTKGGFHFVEPVAYGKEKDELQKKLRAAQEEDKKDFDETTQTFNTAQSTVYGAKLFAKGSAMTKEDLWLANKLLSTGWRAGEGPQQLEQEKYSFLLRDIASQGLFYYDKYNQRHETVFQNAFQSEVAQRLRIIDPSKNWSKEDIIKAANTDIKMQELLVKYFGPGGALDYSKIGNPQDILAYGLLGLDKDQQSRFWLDYLQNSAKRESGEKVLDVSSIPVTGGVKVEVHLPEQGKSFTTIVPVTNSNLTGRIGRY